jgi:hypothetical protein
MVTTYTFRPAPLNLRIPLFVRKVIRHQNLLLKKNLSNINKMKALKIIESLTIGIGQNYTELGAARYFLDKASDVMFLIKDDDQIKLCVFNELLEKSKKFVEALEAFNIYENTNLQIPGSGSDRPG